MSTTETRETWDHVAERRARILDRAAALGWPDLDPRPFPVPRKDPTPWLIPGRFAGPGACLTGYAVSEANAEQLAEMEARLMRLESIAGLDMAFPQVATR